MLCWGTSTVKKLSTLAVYNLTYIYVRLDWVINYSSTLPWLRADLVTFLLSHLASEVGASQNRSKLAKVRFRQRNCHRKMIYKGKIFTHRGVMSIIRFSKFPAGWLFSQWLTPPYFPPYIRKRPRHEVILLRLRLRLRLEPSIRADLGNVFSLALAILWSPEVKIIKGHRHIL